MKIKIVAVGKMKAPERAIAERYIGRLPWPVDINEVPERQGGGGAKGREADLIAAQFSPQSTVIALTEGGRQLSSREFAKTIDRYREDAHKELVFLIGGADGLGESLIERSDMQLSMGSMTWPHMLVRAMLLEQLYRASSILAGHPYHRD